MMNKIIAWVRNEVYLYKLGKAQFESHASRGAGVFSGNDY